jgi:hypothetical protein
MLENRLREAFRADAETVRPEAIRDLPRAAAQRSGRRVRTEPGRKRLAISLTAAAAVAAIALTASVVAQGMSGRSNSRPHAPGSIAAGYRGALVPGVPAPRFFVAITARNNTNHVLAANLEVLSSATGRVLARLAPPGPGLKFQQVAALGSDQRFVAEVSSPSHCGAAWFYQFHLTPQGQPAGLAPLAVPAAPGNPVSLAASANGKVIAYDSTTCHERVATSAWDWGQVGVIQVSTRKVTSWTYGASVNQIGGLSPSLSADGSLLGVTGNPDNGTRTGRDGENSEWVLPTGSAPGRLGQRYRRAVGPSAGSSLVAGVLSPTGSVTFALTASEWPARAREMTVRAYQTATGWLSPGARVLLQHGRFSGPAFIAPDVSGRYLLAYQYAVPGVWRLDLATGRHSVLRGSTSSLGLIDIAW